MRRCPLRSPGSIGSVPLAHGTMGRSDSLPPIWPNFVAFVWRYHRFVPCSSPPARDGICGSTWSWWAVSPAALLDGNGRVSQVPERPSCPCALFLDPGRTEHASPLRRLGAAPACVNNGGSREQRFRGSIARHWDSLSTLRSEGSPSPRKTRFRLLAKLCRAGFVDPQGCMKGFRVRVSFSFLELT